MSRLIDSLTDVITVEYRQVMIMDLDGANGVPEGAEDLWELSDRATVTNWFIATANVGIITSEADDWHRVEVTLELWDGEPPADDTLWARSETVELYSSSGKLRMVGPFGNSSDKLIDLRQKARNWLVRANVRPGPGARYPDEQPPEGLETYRLQFWPALP
ncbi:hypothetical protein IL992_03250 [Microbispora sp. NEAU-D428]|uniref:hypothetical protein n=1 Tax=Microbispora sitophila TaxID=2771537 RepID=UPI001866AB7C|nr:hypothetical protein [Microbispora sitophila]MBE3008205.1 hypothetical protein [Microbispora sitophila]